MIAKEERDKLRTLLAAGTAGKWRAERALATSIHYATFIRKPGDEHGVQIHTPGQFDPSKEGRSPDADLIVAAVNALPNLLDALDEAEKSRDLVSESWQEVANNLKSQVEKLEIELKKTKREALGHKYTAAMNEGGEEILRQELERERKDHAETRKEHKEIADAAREWFELEMIGPGPEGHDAPGFHKKYYAAQVKMIDLIKKQKEENK